MTTQDAGGAGYWYPELTGAPGPVDLLNLLRRYRDAERRMRQRTQDSMRMGETDLVALRFLARARQRGAIVRQKELAEALEITGSSASALVDRLERDGYVQRTPHPEDRRSVALVPTDRMDGEVRGTLGAMHKRMLAVAEDLSPEEREAVGRFLIGLAASLDVVDPPEEVEHTDPLDVVPQGPDATAV
ncbi:MarR family transcriptional regulator [Serinibacter arcticus]|uniref:MarR family transcriptional regulator n=1 Tax=Serinibacter arcticus TaxID=1655435 RepID=A0A2U1ZRY4_9MICO|nr:MarR family transcriptional regulator [Serinibacter arcticus]PWD49703.1 MarR family transcriptional regulator [Serinibacter arcticus]